MTENAPLMTVADVIDVMGISRSTWQKLIRQGETPPVIKLGGVHRIRRDAFDVWLRQREGSTN